jgi:hypothetical protein
VTVWVRTPLQPSTRGGSGTFLAECTDGGQWWIKPSNHLQGGKVLVTEFLVGRLGALIGAPVCEVALIGIGPEVVGWEFRPGHVLVAGVGNGSRGVPDAVELNSLEARERDDNRRRHAGVFALYDWCWGGDDQWLYCETSDRMLYSHDHGWYFPETGAEWSEATLLGHVGDPHQAPHTIVNLDQTEVNRLADRLDEVTSEDLASILRAIPPSWPVSNAELGALGFFLEVRARGVADRLRVLAAGLP